MRRTIAELGKVVAGAAMLVAVSTPWAPAPVRRVATEEAWGTLCDPAARDTLTLDELRLLADRDALPAAWGVPPRREAAAVLALPRDDWRHVAEVEGGTLIGDGSGEFSRGLWWHGADGASTLLSEDFVRALVPQDHAVLALVGYPGLPGRVLKLCGPSSRWDPHECAYREPRAGAPRRGWGVSRVIELESAPRAWVRLDPWSILILTPLALYRLEHGAYLNVITTFREHHTWRGRLVLAGGEVYAPSDDYVVRISLGTFDRVACLE